MKFKRNLNEIGHPFLNECGHPPLGERGRSLLSERGQSPLGDRGQFFSPDLVIAVGVFVFGLMLFFSASNSVFAQAELFDSRKQADEVAHSVLNSLILSPGYPNDWQKYSLDDINSIGLASTPNMIDSNKTITLINWLNNTSTYSSLKQKLGLGPYDIFLKISTASGETIFDSISLGGGVIASDPQLKIVYSRIVYYNNESVMLNIIVSLEN
ncbi:MAG: hypothetical protein WC821_04110 [archaeon]|jgi:hypothetical protein